MAKRITMAQVLPALWDEYGLASRPETFKVSKATFVNTLQIREVAASDSVINRLWTVLLSTELEKGVLIAKRDTFSGKAILYCDRIEAWMKKNNVEYIRAVTASLPHTHTHTYIHTAETEEGA